MLFISDVHHGLDSLKLLPKTKEPIVILGDLINWIDYRNGDGIARDVFGDESLNKLIQLRKDHNFDERKNLWQELFAKDPKKKQREIEDAIERQYKEVFEVLKDYEVWMIPGNVDSLKIFESVKTNNVSNVDGQVLEYKNHKFGFAGGGVPTPIKARGEISEEDFEDKLNKLVDVDIICTHAPPLIDHLIIDVITNKKEQGWESLKQYIVVNKPKLSLFGDVHQPRATKWMIGSTLCMNVGYFRANSHYLELSSIDI